MLSCIFNAAKHYLTTSEGKLCKVAGGKISKFRAISPAT